MATHLGRLRIGVQECRLDEEDVGAFGEPNDLFLISFSLTFRAKWANEAATYEREEVRRPLDRTLRA
jgi:hypothetical protein